MLQTSERLALAELGYSEFGFKDFLVPLYAHKASGEYAIGDVVTKKRVINPSQPNTEEMAYFVRKQRFGWFTWPPSECMAKEFRNSKDVGRYQERHAERLPPTMGCRWCRANQGSEGAGERRLDEQPSSTAPGLPSAAEQTQSALEETGAPAPSATGPVAANAYPCPLCGGGADSVTGFKIHMSLKHTSTPVKSRRTRKGAGKEKK